MLTRKRVSAQRESLAVAREKAMRAEAEGPSAIAKKFARWL